MKTISILLLLLLLSNTGRCQNLPACDSLVINCCTFNVLGPNTIALEVTNLSTVLFDYPGFALFDTNMDTIAIEQVDYFGIGNFPQEHTLTLTAPLTLPFNGLLNLYMLFYDSLACSFPITIPDTTTGMTHPINPSGNILIFPHPVNSTGKAIIETNFGTTGEAEIIITDLQGRKTKSFSTNVSKENRAEIDFGNLAPGFYLLRIEQKETIFSTRLVKL